MKVVPFLIFWSLQFLQIGGYSQPLSSRGPVALYVQAQASTAVIRSTHHAFFPDDPSAGSLFSSLWDEDEEDSLEDLFFDTGYLLSGGSGNAGRDDLSSIVRAHHDLLRAPSRPHPLRC